MRIVFTLSAILVLISAAGCGKAPLGATDAARIGDMVITMEDLNREILRIPPYQRATFETLRGKRALLDHLIERELLLLAAKDAGLENDPEVLEIMGDTERQLEDIRARAMGQVLYQRLVIEGVTVPDSLVEDYYTRNRHLYHTPARAMVSHILVSSQSALDDVLNQLDQGVPFDTVAAHHSEHRSTSTMGGRMGWADENGSVPFIGNDPELLRIFLDSEPGTILPPYTTNLGTHVFLVSQVEEESFASLETARPRIEVTLKPALVNDYFRNTFMPSLYSRYSALVHDTPVDGVYAVVGSTSYTEEDIQAELMEIPPYQRSAYETPEGRRLILDSMVEKELMRLAAVDEGMEADSMVVAQLEQASMQLEDTLRGALIQHYYQRHVVDMVQVPEEQIMDYYNSHTGDIYKQHPQIRISMITAESAPGIEAILTELQSQDFGDVAAAMSAHGVTGRMGGDLGWIPQNAPLPYISDELDILDDMWQGSPGDIFGPEETNLGLAVFQLTDRLDEGVKPLEEVRSSIEAALRPSLVTGYLHDTVFPSLMEHYGVEINEAAFLPGEDIEPDSLMTLAQQTMGTDPLTAVTYFRLFIDRFPDNPRCDQAQFLIGFTFSEQLRDYDAARSAFRKLVEDYPESELADDAQWMIENMELPIEQFIPAEPLEETEPIL